MTNIDKATQAVDKEMQNLNALREFEPNEYTADLQRVHEQLFDALCHLTAAQIILDIKKQRTK